MSPGDGLQPSEEKRREMLARVDAVVNRYVAKLDRERQEMQKRYVTVESGQTYRISGDGKMTRMGTSPQIQLVSTDRTDVPNNADRDLQLMRERLGTAEPKTSKVDSARLEEAIYEIRDEWCTDTGEWDASKMPVPELAARLAKKLSKEKPPW